MRAHLKRWATRAGAAALTLISGVVVIALLALIAVHSSWGRDYIRETIETKIAERLSVPVVLRSARVDLSGHIELGGLVIGERGRVARVPSLSVDIDVAEAIGGRIRISNLELEKPYVDVLALTDALVLPERTDDDEPLDVVLEHIEVTEGHIVVGEVDVMVDSLSGSLRMGEVLLIPEATITGAVRFGELSADVDGTVRLVGDLLLVDSTTVTSSGASIRIHFGALDIASRQALAFASAVAPVADVHRLAGLFGKGELLAPLSADIELPMVAGVLSSTDPLSLWGAVAGSAGSATVRAWADYQGDDIRGGVFASNANPAQLWHGSPEASLHVELSGGANLSSFDLGILSADVAGTAGGAIAGETVELTKIDLEAKNGTYIGSLHARTEYGTADASATAVWKKGAWSVTKSSATATNLGLGMLGIPGLRGNIEKLELEAKGPVTKLRIGASVQARSVRYDRASANTLIGSMSVTANLLSLPDLYPTSGGVAVTARGVSYGGEKLATVTAEGQFADLGKTLSLELNAAGSRYAKTAHAAVTIQQSAAKTKVTFDELSVTTTDVKWAGAGGSITVSPSGRIQLEDIALSSSAGVLSANGVLYGEVNEDDELVVVAKNIDLDRVGRIVKALFGTEVPLAGQVSLKAVIRDDGQRVTVDGSFSDLAYREIEQKLSGDLSLALANGGLSVVVNAEEMSSSVTLKVDGVIGAPRSVFDGAAWARVDLGSVRRGVIDLERITPELVASIIDKPLDATGTVDVHVEVDPGATRLAIDISARKVAVAGMDKLEADIGITWDETGATVDITTRRRKRALAKLTGLVDVPLSAAASRTPAGWKRTEVSGVLSLDRFALNRLNRLNIVREPLLGTLTAKVKISGTIERPVGEIERGEIVQFRLAGAQLPTIELGGRADTDGAHAWLRATQTDGGSLDSSISVEWLRPENTVLDITARKLDLRVLRAFAKDPTHILAMAAGSLDARVHLTGSPSAPVGKGSLSLRGGQILLEGGARRLTKIELDAKFDDAGIEIERLSARSGEGSISARGSATLRNYLPETFTLEAQTQRLPYAIGAFAIGIDAKMRIEGKIEGGWIRANLQVTRGLVRLARSGRALHDTGELADVVFIDEIGKPGEKIKTGGIPPIELKVSAKVPIRVKGPELDIQVRPLLTAIFLDGSLNSVQGRVWTTGGWIELFDRHYTVLVAQADFDGRIDNPAIDIQISRQFPAADIRVHVYNEVADPKVSLTSDGGHSPAEVVSIMLGGDPDSDDRSLGQKATGATYGAGSLIAKDFAQLLPVHFDVVRLHDDGIEVGRWFWGRVLAGYRYRQAQADADENQHEGTLEWTILRRLVLEARYGDRAIGNADLLYILRF